jgi:ribonuclease HI
MNEENNLYIAYTDGSCDNLSPYGEGGSAYILIYKDSIIKEAKKGFVGTTNNRMEMLAIISAVKSTPKNADLVVFTDSQYCITSFTNVKKPKKNLDLINLYHHCASHLKSIEFRWVKGHNGDEYNELVDSMAYSAYLEMIEKYNLPKTRVRR